ncbi:MAG: type II secretion system F family protein [Actinobacteria bacterium]|nr:type II secretion system F family protein [Actinomycetota bacterium]MBI3686211.1 type II secretion system F family protein [Actinomycetota bacterium]
MTTPVTWLVLAGGLTGGGIALAVSGITPPRPALVEVLDRLSGPPTPPVTSRRRLDLAVAAPWTRLGLPRAHTRQDLAICDRDPAEYLAQHTVLAVAGMLTFGALPVLWGVGGPLPLWLALLGAALTVRVTHTRLRAAAVAHREQMRETLSTLLDLMGGSLTGGAGIEQALDDTMEELTGPAAGRLRRELAAAAQTRGRQRLHTWTALRELDTQIGVDELTELATAIEQATSGAPVAETMAGLAHTMRTRGVAEMERASHARSAQMALPIMLFGFGYLIFLLYAAMGAISAGLNH